MARITDIPHRIVNAGGVTSATTIHVRQAGTSTDVDIFSDEALTNRVPNPYMLSPGNAVPMLYHDFPGKVSVEVTQGGSTVFDDDPYDQPVGTLMLRASDADKGASMVGFGYDDFYASDSVGAAAQRVIDVTAPPFNCDNSGATDCAAGIQAAVDLFKSQSWKAKIYFPAGIYKIETTINLTGINATTPTNLPGLFRRRLIIEGAGSGSTTFIGGEAGYGFFELIGSSLIDFRGFSILADRSSNQPQYGICGGRKGGNASVGYNNFDDIYIMGKFSKAACFMMSAELCSYDDAVFYPQTGHGLVLAMNNLGWGITPKFETFGTGLGGNGVIVVRNCQFLSATAAAATDRLLAVEYSQVFCGDSLYFASSTNDAHIYLRKMGGQFMLRNSQFETYGALDPASIYIASDDPNDPNDQPDYRDLTLLNNRLLRFYAEDNVRIAALTMFGNVWRGAHTTHHLDVGNLFDSHISSSVRLPNQTLVLNPRYRVRKSNAGNFWSGLPRSSIELSMPSLDTFQGSESEKRGPAHDGLNTIPGAAISNSGIYAPLAAGSVPGTDPFALFVDLTVPEVIDGNGRMIVGLGTSPGNLGGANTASIFVTNGRLFVRTYGPTSASENTWGTVDVLFFQQLAGRRVSLMLVCAGATPVLYVDGYKAALTQVLTTGTRQWTDAINGNHLLVGFQSTAATSNLPARYHAAGLFNFAPTETDARAIASGDLPETMAWGSSFAGSIDGCIGWWDFASGGGNRIPDASPFAQHASITGTTSRDQRAEKFTRYMANAGTPAGNLTPSFVGQEVLDTTNKAWFKATGLANTDWQAL